MKKTIIILGLALVAFTNVTEAKTISTIRTSTEVLDYDNSPLCKAIQKGDLEAVKKFIEYGADVNEKSNGLTPLMSAARYNKVDIIKYLLGKGADKKVIDQNGNTALRYAENSKSLDAIEVLKQA
jgi:ankyrin repeat protein